MTTVIPNTDYGLTLAMVRNANNTGLDIDITGRLEDDPIVAMENAIIARFTTLKGSIPEYPEYGEDLRRWLEDEIDKQKMLSSQRLIVEQLLLDERIADAKASLTYNQSTSILLVKIEVELVTGEVFSRTLKVTDVTLEILAMQPNNTATQ